MKMVWFAQNDHVGEANFRWMVSREDKKKKTTHLGNGIFGIKKTYLFIRFVYFEAVSDRLYFI